MDWITTMKPVSFLINTSVNAFDHTRLLLESLRQNLSSPDSHEFIVFVDSDNQGTEKWLNTQKDNFRDLKIVTHNLPPCIGYSRNNNLLVDMAKNEIVSYLQSDMVVSKDYDLDILKDLKENQILSSTRIEPPLHGQSYEKVTKDFGVTPDQFNLKEFTEFAQTVKEDKRINYFFAPLTFYKKTWQNSGGYDTLFRRSREDSDLLQRLVHQGVEITQTFNANVYHFTCIASRGKDWFDRSNAKAQRRVMLQQEADGIELRKFIRKWGAFTHGMILNRYDVDVVFEDEPDIATVEFSEPYYSRVWSKEGTAYAELSRRFSSVQSVANSLLNFTNDQWDSSKKYYNVDKIDEKLCIGRPKDYNVLVTLKGKPMAGFAETTSAIHRIIEQYDIGVYNYGEAQIDIRKKVLDNPPLKVINPKFDMSLLEIK